MKYIIELSDQGGKSCRVKLDLPLKKSSARTDNSTWRVLDEGFLKFRSGGCAILGIRETGLIETDESAWFALSTLLLYVGKTPLIKVDEFEDRLGFANSSGEGEIKQEVVTGFKPGKITWTLLE